MNPVKNPRTDGCQGGGGEGKGMRDQRALCHEARNLQQTQATATHLQRSSASLPLPALALHSCKSGGRARGVPHNSLHPLCQGIPGGLRVLQGRCCGPQLEVHGAAGGEWRLKQQRRRGRGGN